MDVGQLMRTLSEPTRYKIVQLLLERHHCSRSLSKMLGISESAVSQHMALLKEQGLVTSFRHGYHIHYVLNREAIEGIRSELGRWLSLMDSIEDCHGSNSCQFKLGDKSTGCLYRISTKEKGINAQ